MSPQEIRAVLATFPHRFDASEDHDGVPRLVFHVDAEGMMISDPTHTSCGRFLATPDTYQLSAVQQQAFQLLSMQMENWAAGALNEVAGQVQAMIGVTAGDVAGVYFSDDSAQQQLHLMALNYLAHELNHARELQDNQPSETPGPAPSAGV